MDHHPIRSQVSALEAQLISLEQSLALLPADQRALVGADLDRMHAAIARFSATVDSEPGPAGNPGEGAAGTPEIATTPAADQPVWTAERTTRLYAISTALSVALTPARVASVVVNQTLPALSAAAAMIMLAGDNGVLKLVDAAGSGRIAAAPDPASPLAEVARTGQPAWLETPQDILVRYPGWPDAMATPPASLAVVPLIVQGRVWGVMAVGFAAPRPFTHRRSCLHARPRAAVFFRA